MADRRTLLRGLAALPLAGLASASILAEAAPPALASSAPADPLLDLLARSEVMLAHARAADDESADAFFDRYDAMLNEAYDMRASTLAGALASLEWARAEFGRIHVEEEDKKPGGSDWMDRLTLNMLDSALGVLRPMVEGGARG